MTPPLKILVVEDSPADTELMLRELHRAGLDPEWLRVDNEVDFLDHLDADLDLILSDFQMPQFDGLRALELVRKRSLAVPFILVSGTIGEDTAVEAMRQGATDYLLKDRLTRLGSAVKHALEGSRLRKERKVSIETLRLREVALNSVSQGVLVSDEHRRVIYANTAFTELTGYAGREILGHSCSFLQGPDTEPATILKIRAALDAGESFEGEILNYRKDGRPFWNELFIGPLRGEPDDPLRFIGIQRDVTERRRVQEEMLWKTAFLEAQVNSSLDATIVVNEEGRKILQNQQVVDLFRIPPHIANDPDDKIQVRWVTEVTKNPGEFADKVRYLYAHPEEASHDEIALKDGKILDRYSFPVVGEDGRYYGRTWTFRDISERKRSEEHLRTVAERLHLATEASQVGIWEFDVVTKILEWDAQMHILHGLPADDKGDLIEQSERSIHPDDRAGLISAFNEALRSRAHPLITEFRIVRANDGCQRILRSMATVIWDGSGQPQRMIGTNWDVTEGRTRERKLSDALAHEKELSEKARAGDRAKGEFLAVMSHEIRTPLNGILGFSELLAKIPDLPCEARDYVETISSSGESLLRILNDVLDYSRLEAGLVQVEKTGFTPREILGDIHALLSQQARHKGLAFGVSIEENIPEKLTGDPGRLRQILINLAGNALKFTESGSVTMGLRPMGDAANYEFFVKDTGCGIPPEHIERIFQPFTQADSSVSRRHGGSGLGLSISRRLAELLGGTLTVRSQPGQGSEFTLSMPLSLAATSPETAPLPSVFDSSFSAERPLRILIVEDDKVNLKLMLSLVRRLGYEPFAAKNGIEAVEIHRLEQIDCVLMDPQMPEMDGIEATEAIRSQESSTSASKPAFISALTANIVPADRQRCFDAGMNSYLNKPVKMAALASLLIEAASYVMRP
ncbi:MAG: response regulator [Terrimicrobiaceae bacterium]